MIELILWVTGLMLFSFWLNYCMGNPLADNPNHVDVGAIFFFFPKWLADRRLRQNKIFHALRIKAQEEVALEKDPLGRIESIRESERWSYQKGREFFNWEKSILCPICFHWWLTVLFTGVCLGLDLLHVREQYMLLSFTYLLNHLFIRKIV